MKRCAQTFDSVSHQFMVHDASSCIWRDAPEPFLLSSGWIDVPASGTCSWLKRLFLGKKMLLTLEGEAELNLFTILETSQIPSRHRKKNQLQLSMQNSCELQQKYLDLEMPLLFFHQLGLAEMSFLLCFKIDSINDTHLRWNKFPATSTKYCFDWLTEGRNDTGSRQIFVSVQTSQKPLHPPPPSFNKSLVFRML